MANNPHIDIGVRVDYKDVLEQMKSSFKKELTEISNHAKKTSFDANIEKELNRIDDKVDSVFGGLEKRIDELGNQTVSADNFEKYQREATNALAAVKKSVTNVTTDIANLRTEVGMLSGADFASDIRKQFDEMRDSMMGTCQALKDMLDLTKPLSGQNIGLNSSELKDYKNTLAEIRKAQKEVDDLDFSGSSDDDLFDRLSREEKLLNKQVAKYKEIKAEMSSISESSPEFSKLENSLVRAQSAISKTSETIQELDREIATRDLGAGMEDDTRSIINSVKSFDDEIDNFVGRTQKMIQANKEVQNSVEQTQTAFNTFQIKNGAIHVPVEVATKSGTLQKQLQETIDKLQEYAQKNSIIAKVKLVLDSGSTGGYKKNDDIAKQLEDGQSEPAVDISKAIKKTYVQAVREAEKTAKDSIKAIQAIFDGSPVKITPNKEAFTTELSAMVSASLGKIAEDTTGVKVNQELEKLVTNLKEVSTSLSGNENFKLGLDEASIERITKAIQNMADMIQRAFGVASNDDIASQWGVIESRFKAVAGEEGKLLKGKKEHKIAIQELAIEYKKYLDMGGKNDLSELTAHKQTVKNITAEYENLGKAAQEAAQKQEKAVKNPKSTKVSSEEKEAINAVSRENKKLEMQAGNTGTALDNESKVAQTAAERFAELAEKKKAATDANLELGIAAEMTTKALKEEMAALKEAEQRKKSNKKAVDEDTYESNALGWQSDIKQYLLDSGEYANIYESEISRAENGTVKFTATVKTMGDELNEVEGEWKKYTATVNSSGEISSFKLKDLTDKKSQKIEEEMELLRQLSEQADGEEKKSFDKSEMQAYASIIIDATQALETFNTKYSVFVNKSGGLSIIQQVTKDNGQVETFTAKFRDVESVIAAITDETKSFKQTLEESFDGGSFTTSIKDFASKAQEAFDAFYRKNKGDTNFDEIRGSLDKLKNIIKTIDSDPSLKNFEQKLKDLGVTLKNIGKDNKLGKLLAGERTFKDINEVRANIDSLFASMGKVNEKSIRVTGTNKLTAEVKAANGEIRQMTVALDSKNFARFVDNGIVEFGRLRAAAEGVFKGIQSMIRIYLSPSDFIRYFRQGFDAVKEIDTAMTELRKVSDASPNDITAYFDDAVESAKELGSSVNEMIGATADWQRMGYNLPDSRELGEVAILYKNVGDGIDVDTANESLTSTMQGFQLQAKDAMSVIDAFNEVSNNYAISSAGIGEALKRSAAAFNAANTDLNQAIALITAGNEIVQSPEKVGTMWQTVSARIRGKFLCPLRSNMQTTYEDNIKVA